MKIVECVSYGLHIRPYVHYEVHELRPFLFFWKRWVPIYRDDCCGKSIMEFYTLEEAQAFVNRAKTHKQWEVVKTDIGQPHDN